jgi:quercetin dioxygenase-like cupin family protein
MAAPEQKTFERPDEVREFPLGRGEVVQIEGGEVLRMTLQPGWRWSEHTRPLTGTELCEAPHFMYVISGGFGVRMADGRELALGPGDVAVIPPGHDAWVVGDEPFVALDWGGAHVWGIRRFLESLAGVDDAAGE